jgi:hypothetical protein
MDSTVHIIFATTQMQDRISEATRERRGRRVRSTRPQR